MATPSFATEAAAAGNYPANRFNQRERKLLASISTAFGAPVYAVKAAGTFTTVAGSAAQTIPVTGTLSTDIVHVTLRTAGATPRTVLTAAPATGQINVTMSLDPSSDHVLQYTVLRLI